MQGRLSSRCARLHFRPVRDGGRAASGGADIVPFAEFLARLVEKRLAGERLPEVPKGDS
jgi:hypothetical protein